MKSSIFAVPALLMLIASPAIAADEARYVSVDGSATIKVAPDRATLRVAVQARSEQLDVARSEVAVTTRAFLDFASAADIDDDDIQTSGLSIRPEYRWDNEDKRQVMLGYFVQRDIIVELHDVDDLGSVMEGAVDKGINQVQPPEFHHSNEKELRRRALAAATEDARANAMQIAGSLGVKLGDVRSVRANEVFTPPQPMMRAVAMSEAQVGGADTYSVGQISIEARVSAEFDLVP